MELGAIVNSMLSEMRILYLAIAVLTAGASIGGAWATVRFGVKQNGREIGKANAHIETLYIRTNDHNVQIARLDERSEAVNKKLDQIHEEIKRVNNGKNPRPG